MAHDEEQENAVNRSIGFKLALVGLVLLGISGAKDSVLVFIGLVVLLLGFTAILASTGD